MRRSFKCPSHWTHILQNKDSLFVKCCLLSESLATTHRAPQPHLLWKTASSSVGRGGSAPGLFLVMREILSSRLLDSPKHSAPGWGLLPTGRGQGATLLLLFPQVGHFILSFCSRSHEPEPSQLPITWHHGDLPSHGKAGRSGTRPCPANVRAFQKIH